MPVGISNLGETARAAADTADRHLAFDFDALLKRCMGDRTLAAGLVDKFTSHVMKTIREIESLLAAEDWSLAGAKVHSLKGEAGSLAATQVQARASVLEKCLRTSCFAEATACFSALKSAAEECASARSSILKRLSEPAAAPAKCR